MIIIVSLISKIRTIEVEKVLYAQRKLLPELFLIKIQ